MTTSMPRTRVAPPGPDEYGAYYGRYIARVPADTDILEVLERQGESTLARFSAVPEARGSYRYAPGKWSIKELALHLGDTERIMAYRALRVARADQTPLPGFDENAYTPASGADAVPLAELAQGLSDVRRATLSLLRVLPADAWTRRGTASEAPVSVRSLAWIIAGHELHHLEVLAERYGV
ncbi:MAG: DinB family protein [Gemmatimonadales bacterium]